MNKLTELETKVLNFIADGDWFEDVPAECFENIMEDCKLSHSQLKGVLSSLYKKDLINDYAQFPNGMTAYRLNNN